MPRSMSRAQHEIFTRTGAVFLLGLGLAWLAAGGVARADRIMLRGGGQIRGKLIADPSSSTRWLFIGEAGRNPIIYKKEQILQITPEKSALDEYVVRRAKDRPLAEEEFQLAIWCEEHHLPDLARNHLDSALKLDPRFAPAHEKLGHVLDGERWLDADGQKEAQGMVKYRGRWMQPEEKERLEDQAAQAAEGQSWTRRIRIFREAYLSGADSKAKDAERRLLAIREPAAVGAVARILGEDDDANVRELAGRVLGAIPGPESSAAMVGRLLGETNPEVRARVLTEVARRDPEEVVPRLVRALKSPRTEVINRAAFGLAQINAKSAVPQLIPALISTETRTELVVVNGGGGGGMGSGVPAVGFNNYTGSTYLGLTPPVVGPGVIAFGATGVPYGTGASIGGGGGVSVGGSAGGINLGHGGVAGGGVNGVGFNSGAGNVGGVNIGAGGGGGMMSRVVTIEHPNTEVLAALVKLTGKDFGYDSATWKRWATSFRSDPAPSRRVVQP